MFEFIIIYVQLLCLGSAVAEYLSKGLPYKLSPDDVFLTIGCAQALEAVVTVLARPGANILLPRPGFPFYEARAGFASLEVRHFDLVPEKDWEVDLASVEALADENTAAMVIINPGNPCGNVFTYEHLKKVPTCLPRVKYGDSSAYGNNGLLISTRVYSLKVAETAKKLGILVIADEVYGHLTFGSNPFVSMGVFASISPIITLGSISKRWVVPGWKLGWLVSNDPDGILTKQGVFSHLSTLFHFHFSQICCNLGFFRLQETHSSKLSFICRLLIASRAF